MKDKSNEEIKPDENQKNTSNSDSSSCHKKHLEININKVVDIASNETEKESKVNSSDIFPVASMLSNEIKPYSDPSKFLDFHSTNTSDRIQYEKMLTTDSDSAWRYARRSNIFHLTVNTESQQKAEPLQDPQLDPRIFADFMNQFPSIFNFKSLHKQIMNEGEFTVQKYLGSGSYGVVLQVQSRDTDEMQAMKLYPTDPNDLSSFKERLAEMKVLTNISHVNILPYYGFREYESHLGIILKFVDEGTLRDLLEMQPISEFLAADLTSQILRGMSYLHDHECIHRDIKPSNILITSFGVVKLADFGSSKFLNDLSTFNQTHATTLKGTLMYLAPEVIQRSEYRKECDIWSLGSVIFEMMTNKHICEETTKVGIYKWKRGLNDKVILPEDLSELSNDIISICLEIKPENRPSCDQLFKHKWFKEEQSFEKWIKMQKLLPDDSDSKQNEDELAQEKIKRTIKHKKQSKFCRRVRKQWKLTLLTLIMISIFIFLVVHLIKMKFIDKEPISKANEENAIDIHKTVDTDEQKRVVDREEQRRVARKKQKRIADREEQKRIVDLEEQKRVADREEQKRVADHKELNRIEEKKQVAIKEKKKKIEKRKRRFKFILGIAVFMIFIIAAMKIGQLFSKGMPSGPKDAKAANLSVYEAMVPAKTMYKLYIESTAKAMMSAIFTNNKICKKPTEMTPTSSVKATISAIFSDNNICKLPTEMNPTPSDHIQNFKSPVKDTMSAIFSGNIYKSSAEMTPTPSNYIENFKSSDSSFWALHNKSIIIGLIPVILLWIYLLISIILTRIWRFLQL